MPAMACGQPCRVQLLVVAACHADDGDRLPPHVDVCRLLLEPDDAGAFDELLHGFGKGFHRATHGIDAVGCSELGDKLAKVGSGHRIMQVGEVQIVAGQDDDVGLQGIDPADSGCPPGS